MKIHDNSDDGDHVVDDDGDDNDDNGLHAG